jgi:hypothetical protein
LTQELNTLIGEVGGDRHSLTYESVPGLDPREAESKLDAFVAELWKMTSDERVRASRYTFNRWELWVWAARFPDEVPLINGEYEWLALKSADVLD